MGLGFHAGQGGIDNLGEYLGELDMEEHSWLQKNGFLIAGETGHLPDPLESLPYFDDVVLTHAHVKQIKERFDVRKREAIKTVGFNSKTIEKLDLILNKALSKGLGLSTCAD